MRVGEVLRRVRNRMSWWLHFQQLFARRKTTLRTGRRGPLQPAALRVLEPRVLLSGTTELQEINVGNLRSGVSGPDPSTASGYVMYSEQDIHDRFSGMEVSQADHFVAVRLTSGNQWSYYNNETLISFTPVATDRLVATVDFAADTATALNGQSFIVNGIQGGYHDGDLMFTPNQFGGVYNAGEFGMTGTYFRVDEDAISAGNLRYGIAANDANEGTGYVMYSQQVASTRFSSIDTGNADHFIMVRDNAGQWQYDTNYNWINFTPIATDRLVASVNFSTDTILALEGQADVVNGINFGYADGDLAFTANTYNGSPNAGEFGITGTYFTVANLSPTNISLSANSLNENLPIETVVGSFSAIDPNVEAGFSYSLVSGTGSTDNAQFSISGTQLLAAASFNYEAKSSYSVRVRTTDTLGSWYEKVFSIDVNDLNDPPEAMDDTASVVIGDSVEIDVLANDSDPEETDLTIKSIGAVSSGSAEIITLEGGGQKIRYTASGGAVGEITFTYTIEDEEGLTDTATITVDVSSYDPDPGNLLPTDDLGSPDLLNDLLDGIGPYSPVVAQPLTLPEIGSVPDMVSQANVADFLLADFDVSSHGNVSSSVSGLTSTDTTTTSSTELGGTFVVDVTTITSYTRTGTENTTGEWSYEDVFSMTYSYLTTFTHDTASLAYTLLQTGSLSYTFEAMFVDGVLTFSITDYLQVDDYLLTMTGSIEEDATPDEDTATEWTYTNSTTEDELGTEIPDVYSGSQEVMFDYSQSVERDANDEIIDQTISQDLNVEVTDSYTTARSELWKSISDDPEVPDSTTILLAKATGVLSWSLISSYDQVIEAGDLVSLSESFAYESAADDHSTLDLTSSLNLSATALVSTLLMDQPEVNQTETLTQLSTYSEEVTSSVDYTFNGERTINASGEESFTVTYDYLDNVDGNSQEDSEGTYHSELTGDEDRHVLDTYSFLDEDLFWGSSLDSDASNVKSSTGTINTASRLYEESMDILSTSELNSTLSKLTAPGNTSTSNESILIDEYNDFIDSTYTFEDQQNAIVTNGIAYYSGRSTSDLLSDESVDMTSTTQYRPSQSAGETPDVIVTVIDKAEFATESHADLTVVTDYDIIVNPDANSVTTDTVQTTDDLSHGFDEIILTSTVTSVGPISGSAGTGQTESTLISTISSTSDWEYDLNDVLTTSITIVTSETLVQTDEGEVEAVQIEMAIDSEQVTTLHSEQSGTDSVSSFFSSRTVLATGSLADDLSAVSDLDEFTFGNAELLGENLDTQDGSILIAEITSSDTSSNAFSSILDTTTTLTILDDEIIILAYGDTVETFSDDDAETNLLTTTELESHNIIDSGGDFDSQIFHQEVTNEDGLITMTILNSLVDDSYDSEEKIDEWTDTSLSSGSVSGVTSLTIDTYITQSSDSSGKDYSDETFQIFVEDPADVTYEEYATYYVLEDITFEADSQAIIDIESTTTSHDANNDGTLSEDEIVTTNAPSTITSDSYFETDEEVTVDNQTFLKEGDVTETTDYYGFQKGITKLETDSDMTIDADGSIDLVQTSILDSEGDVLSESGESYLYLNTTENEKEGHSQSFSGNNHYDVHSETTYTLNDNKLTGLITETVLTELTSSSNTLSYNDTSGSSGPALGASTSSFTGENSVNSTSSAEVTDWQEVITDEEGVEVSSAFETRRQLLDATTVTGEYSGSSSSGSYSSTYEDKTARRVTEVHLGDEDYEYFFKDQVSGAKLTSTSSGQPEQTQSARIHNTLEYEILHKGTENEVFREWAEQSYLRGMMIGTVVNPDGSGGVSSSSDSGRTRVGEYQSGGSGDFAEGSWATDPQATPQAVGGGANPSSTDGPWGGQGGPSEGEGGGEGGEGGGEGGGGDTGGTAGGNTSGSTVTDTTPWEYHEGDVIEGLPGQAIEEPLLHHKPKMTPQTPGYHQAQRFAAAEQYDSARSDIGDRILSYAGEYMSIPVVTPFIAENVRRVVGDDVLINSSGNQLVAGTVLVAVETTAFAYFAAELIVTVGPYVAAEASANWAWLTATNVPQLTWAGVGASESIAVATTATINANALVTSSAGAAISFSALASDVGAVENATPVPTGQIHHPISTKPARALNDHPTLSGKYQARDPRFTTQAIDSAAHRGYQTWHRELDERVVKWVKDLRNQGATTEQFEAWLRELYRLPDLLKRFPNGF